MKETQRRCKHLSFDNASCTDPDAPSLPDFRFDDKHKVILKPGTGGHDRANGLMIFRALCGARDNHETCSGFEQED